jgi:hypothetical protein
MSAAAGADAPDTEVAGISGFTSVWCPDPVRPSRCWTTGAVGAHTALMW